MFKKKIPVLYLILAALIGSAITFFAFTTVEKIRSAQTKPKDSIISETQAKSDRCSYNINRINGYKYIHPVFMMEPDCQSPKFNALEANILEFIEHEKISSGLTTASVYLIDFSENEWMDVNEKEKFHLGSLFKINTLITYLRMAESRPGILDERVLFPKNNTEKVPIQTFNSKTIQQGQEYKIKELLHYMISYSDNNATMLLHHHMDVEVFQKAFSDLGLIKPDIHDINYQMSVKEYSRFIRVLYDAGYLTSSASEYAISLLAESDFKYGIAKELPQSLKIAHKFGEAGNSDAPELHETAIIYLDKRPYLLTIMTRGKDVKKQAETISHISKMVYDKMVADSI